MASTPPSDRPADRSGDAGEPGPPRALRLTAWPDPVIDRLGHDPRSPYVERFWLPVLGPSASWLLRRLARELDARPEGAEIDLALTARSLGLGLKGGRHSTFLRSIDRTCEFGLARYLDDQTLAVRRRLPPLTRMQVGRLPAELRQQHEAWVRTAPTAPEPVEVQRRARRLALSLLEMGEDDEACERQLHRWRFHPAVAHEAVRWAKARLDLPAAPGAAQAAAPLPAAPGAPRAAVPAEHSRGGPPAA